MRIILSMAFAIYAVMGLSAQPRTNISGIWLAKSGTADNPGEAYYTFIQQGDSLKTRVSLPMYGTRFMNMPMAGTVIKNDSIFFPSFEGVYVPEKDRIFASINFMYEAVPYVLERVSEVGKPVLDTAEISPVKPELIFEANGRIWSSPLLSGKNLFFGSDDSCFYTMDAGNGRLIRKFRTNGKVRGETALSGENLVFSSDDGMVYCLDQHSGKLVWKTEINKGTYERREPSMEASEWDYALSSPVVSEGKIFVGSTDSCLYALDEPSGKIIWKFKTDHIVRATPQVSGNFVYAGNWSGKLYAIDINSGQQIWMADLHKPILSQPVISGNRLVTGSRYTWLWCLDATTGREIWKYNYWWSWVESSPVIEEGIIYIGSSDLKRILAIDLLTGKTIWKFRTSGYPYARASLDKSTVYMGTIEFDPDGKSSGFLYLLDKTTGSLKEKINIPITRPGFLDGVFGQAALSDNMIFVASLDGKILAFKRPSH